MKFVFLFIFVFPVIAYSQVDFNWVDSLNADFSFTEEWDYPEGIYINQWGQVSCDGICPMEIDQMKDDQGRVFDDSLTNFYSLVDTTHRYFTHKGTVRTYEFGECNYALAKVLQGKVHIQTEMNAASHTSLHIVFDPEEPFEKRKFKIYLLYNSIKLSSPIVYIALNGRVDISQPQFEAGVIKMSFDLGFQYNSNDPNGMQTWKGKIQTNLSFE